MGRQKTIRVAFIQDLCMEMPGVMHLSSVLKLRGHSTRLFITGLEPSLLDSLARWSPDVVAFQVFTGQHLWAKSMARRIKSRLKVKVVFGGPHATFVPEVIEEASVDAVVRGEGEHVFADYCDSVAKGSSRIDIPGTWAKSESGEITRNPVASPVEDLDALPFPDRDLAYRYDVLGRRGNKTFITGRGCHNPCTFCHNHLAMRMYKGKGPWVRKRSADLVIEEIAQVSRRFPPLRVVNFENDDDILSKPEWHETFFEQYARRLKIPFYIMTRPDHVTDDVIRQVVEAGCVGIALSLETANDKTRKEVLKKRFSTRRFQDAMEIIHRHRLPVKVYNMVGIPGETLDDAIETLKLNIATGATYSVCSILQPYPPSDMFRYCETNGLLKEGYSVDDHSRYYMKESLLDIPEIDAMVNLQKFFPIFARYPGLFERTRPLLKLPRSRAFELLGMAAYSAVGARSYHLTIKEFLELSYYNRKTLRFKGVSR